MPRPDRPLPVSASTPRAASFRTGSALSLGVLLASAFVATTPLLHGDEYTGLAQNDPKDMYPYRTEVVHTQTVSAFQPLPGWSRYGGMPALPDQLQPLGRKIVVASTAPLNPPKPAPAVSPISASTPIKPPASLPPDNPALIAVSPFLQWIKSDPLAASEARKQAKAYQETPPPAAATDASGAHPTEDPYWLPPMTEQNETSSDSGNKPVTGSSATFSQPQH